MSNAISLIYLFNKSVSIDVTGVNVCDDDADVDSAGVVSVTVDVAVDDDSATIQLCLNNS